MTQPESKGPKDKAKEPELKPCPFCGDADIETMKPPPCYPNEARCTSCGAAVDAFMWNRRAPQTEMVVDLSPEAVAKLPKNKPQIYIDPEPRDARGEGIPITEAGDGIANDPSLELGGLARIRLHAVIDKALQSAREEGRQEERNRIGGNQSQRIAEEVHDRKVWKKAYEEERERAESLVKAARNLDEKVKALNVEVNRRGCVYETSDEFADVWNTNLDVQDAIAAYQKGAKP